MASKVVILSQAQKDIYALSKPIQERITEALRDLTNFPSSRGGVKKLKPPFDGYRKRVGSYRILFDHDSQNSIVYVRGVRDRKDAYR